jgi:hypothetical protein
MVGAEPGQRGAEMSQSKAEMIVSRLLSNAAGLQYGSVSVTAKVHNGRVVQISYETTESTKETETETNKDRLSDNP